MNFRNFILSLFVLLFALSSVVLAANNTRNVYSVYSDNFEGAHIYGSTVASGDEDGVKIDLWNRGNGLDLIPSYSGGIEGKEYITYSIKANVWDVVSYSPYNNSGLAPRNMSAYAGGQIKFWARSSNSSFGTATVGFQYRSGGDISFKKTLSELNFNANGQWQELTITLPTNNLDNVISLFIFQANTLTVGDSIDIDNIRWVKNNAGASFSIVRKNTSDNSEVSDQTKPISFSEDYYGQGWVVADQYLEMDIDGEFSSNNWSVRFYSSNDIAGLYNALDAENVLPMAWKVSWTTLPYSYTDSEGPNANTLEIGENKTEAGDILGLYDAGKVEIKGDGAKWWYPWFFVQKNADTSAHSLVINNEGCHTFENTNGSGVTVESFDTPNTASANTYERKPKLFLSCDTKKAKALQYTASLVLSLSYE